MHEFNKAYWEDHWSPTASKAAGSLPINPYLAIETADLAVGTALDAGCGTGTEALWLAEQGWQVTGADISKTALTTAASRAKDAGLSDQIEWLETDVATWQPERTWGLVVTNYAHPETGQLEFYQRIASWVSPGGTLLIVGHLHGAGHNHGHPEHATATPSQIVDLLTAPQWHIDSSYEDTRTIDTGSRKVQLDDVVVRASRIATP